MTSGLRVEASARTEPLLRPHLSAGIVPLGAAYGAKQHRLAAAAKVESLWGQRGAGSVDGRAADERPRKAKAVAVPPSDGLQDCHSLVYYLGADAISGECGDCSLHLFSPLRAAGC